MTWTLNFLCFTWICSFAANVGLTPLLQGRLLRRLMMDDKAKALMEILCPRPWCHIWTGFVAFLDRGRNMNYCFMWSPWQRALAWSINFLSPTPAAKRFHVSAFLNSRFFYRLQYFILYHIMRTILSLVTVTNNTAWYHYSISDFSCCNNCSFIIQYLISTVL